MAFSVPLTANMPTAIASKVVISHLSLSTSGWITATRIPEASAVNTNPLSAMPTGGTAPSITSRTMPPPNAVSHAVMRMANRSYPLRIADNPPTMPQQRMAIYSIARKNMLLSNAISMHVVLSVITPIVSALP